MEKITSMIDMFGIQSSCENLTPENVHCSTRRHLRIAKFVIFEEL